MNHTEEKKILNDFFDILSNRLSKENDLSDFLYALLNSSNEFRKIFYDLLNEKHPQKIDHSNFFEANREINIECIGRPDFLINHISGKDIIIEVKKYDTQYHFFEYNKIVNSIKCLISINKCERNETNKEWILLRWSDLITKMADTEDFLIQSTSILFKKGCGMENVKKVIDREIPSLLFLNRMVKNALEQISINVNKRAKSFSEDGSGYYFEFNMKDCKYFPWLGINYNESENPFGLMFWLNPDFASHRVLAEKFKREKPFHEKYYSNFNSNQVVVMTLTKKEDWDEFFNLMTKEEQISYIRNFVELNLEMIKRY